MRILLYVPTLQREFPGAFSPFEPFSIHHGGSGPSLPEQLTAAILEITEPDAQVGYLLALTVGRQIPVLCLLAKGLLLPEPLAALRSSRPISRRVQLARYTPRSLPTLVERFVREASGAEHERATIKFTLRLTTSLERYLAWRASHLRLDKALILRQFLCEEVMKKDQEYQEFLLRQRNETDSPIG